MKINLSINIEKKHVYFLTSFIAVLFVVGVSAFNTNNPAIFGHSDGEIQNVSASKVLPGIFNGEMTSLFVFPGYLRVYGRLEVLRNTETGNLTINNNITFGGITRSNWTKETFNLSARNITAGTFGANTGNGDYTFPNRLTVPNMTITQNLTLGGVSRDSWPSMNSLSSLYVGECTAPVGGTCKCNGGEKFMFMIGNSAGLTGYCYAQQQGTINVYGQCDSASATGSHFACLR